MPSSLRYNLLKVLYKSSSSVFCDFSRFCIVYTVSTVYTVSKVPHFSQYQITRERILLRDRSTGHEPEFFLHQRPAGQRNTSSGDLSEA